MKRIVGVRLLLILGIVCVVGPTVYFAFRSPLPSGSPVGDPSLVLSEPFRTVHGLLVENGSAYDQAFVDVQPYKRIIVPDRAEVRTAEASGRLEIFMKKSLSFHGHPPEPMSIRTGRNNMGCAAKTEGDALFLATYGEWGSKEGGARIRLVLLVPENTKVERRSELSGPHSAGREWDGKYISKPKEVTEGYWYGPASPAKGWTALPDVPDPARRAGR